MEIYAIQKFSGVGVKDGSSTKMGISPVGDNNGRILYVDLLYLLVYNIKGHRISSQSIL